MIRTTRHLKDILNPVWDVWHCISSYEYEIAVTLYDSWHRITQIRLIDVLVHNYNSAMHTKYSRPKRLPIRCAYYSVIPFDSVWHAATDSIQELD